MPATKIWESCSPITRFSSTVTINSSAMPNPQSRQTKDARLRGRVKMKEPLPSPRSRPTPKLPKIQPRKPNGTDCTMSRTTRTCGNLSRVGPPPEVVTTAWPFSTISSNKAITVKLTPKVMRVSRQYFHRYMRFPLPNHFEKYLRQIHRRGIEHGRAPSLELGDEGVRIGAHDIFGCSFGSLGSEYLATRVDRKIFTDNTHAAEVRAQIVEPGL